MQFSELLDSIETHPGQSSLPSAGDWRQGRAIFGGLQTLLALHAMRTLVADTPLRSLQTTFIQPPASERVIAHASVLRAGKNVTHMEARVVDEAGNIVTLVVGVFGSSRDTVITRQLETRAVSGGTPIAFPKVPGVPSFTRHFDALWLEGPLPFTGQKANSNVVQLAMPGEHHCTEYHLVAMADFIPPVALNHLDRPAPGSSMTWMLEILHHDFDGLPLQDWRIDAEMVAAGAGYTHQSVTITDPKGRPVALSRQNMVVFA